MIALSALEAGYDDRKLRRTVDPLGIRLSPGRCLPGFYSGSITSNRVLTSFWERYQASGEVSQRRGAATLLSSARHGGLGARWSALSGLDVLFSASLRRPPSILIDYQDGIVPAA